MPADTGLGAKSEAQEIASGLPAKNYYKKVTNDAEVVRLGTSVGKGNSKLPIKRLYIKVNALPDQSVFAVKTDYF